DFVPPAGEITADYEAGAAIPVDMHDGSRVMLRKVDDDYDPTDRLAAIDFLQRHTAAGEVVTGLLYIDESKPDMHGVSGTTATPLRDLGYDALNPGAAALAEIQSAWR
ncbi:MAG: 2-oxoacid:ferredoxin oxidoreductase subunit beta, partial [Pseudomonadota bacterium]